MNEVPLASVCLERAARSLSQSPLKIWGSGTKAVLATHGGLAHHHKMIQFLAKFVPDLIGGLESGRSSVIRDMPLHLPPISRRHFIGYLGAALLPAWNVSAASVDEDLVAILNDTHIGAKQKLDSPIPQHLKMTVDYLLGLEKRPSAVLINGDLALRDGQPEDYTLFAKLIQPLREAGFPIHLTMGNHDDREVFYKTLDDQRPAQPVVLSRHVGLVETRYVNFFLLDSLKATMIAEGDLGDLQLDWLKKELDSHTSKPVIVVAHHNPRLGGDPKHFPGGLVDSQPLWDLFGQYRQVKAYVHGHIHDWGLAKHDDVHIANTPAVSYVANPATSTTGWTMARLRPDGITLTTHTHLPDHPWNNKSHDLDWRV
jgi:3',5'-cyclic-AMP phosphodiesterase